MSLARLSMSLTFVFSLALGACTPGSDNGTGGQGGGGGGDGGGGLPASCSYDFDCPVGYVCVAEEGVGGGVGGGAGGGVGGGAGGGAGEVTGTCGEAGAADERTFGQISFEVSADTDVFLMAVYDVPTAAEHAYEYAFFTLDAGDGGLGRSITPLQRPQPAPMSAAWRARLDFERNRRAEIDQLVDDLRAGRRTLWPATGRQNSVCPTACGATEMCWQGACKEIENDTFTMTHPVDGVDRIFQLAAVLTHATEDIELNLVVEDVLWDDADTAIDAAQGFVDTLAFQLGILGQTGHLDPLDRDGDGRMTVVVTNGPCQDVPGQMTCEGIDGCMWDTTEAECRPNMAGFFAFTDFLPHTDPDATGNEADILWAAMPSAGHGAHLTGTLAHEYTHLVSFAVRVHARNDQALREVLWLDEGLAHLNEDLTGWGASNVTTLRDALDSWDTAGFANAAPGAAEIVMRGKAMMLLRHMIDQASTGADAAADATFTAATTLVSDLLTEEALGFEHAAFQDADPDFLWHYLLGVYATGDDVNINVSEAHAHDFLGVEVHPEHEATTGNTTGVDTHGSYDDSLDGSWVFAGPAILEDGFDPDSALAYDGEVYRTGAAYFLLETSSLDAGTVVTVHGRANADLDLRLAVQKVYE